MLKTIYPFLFIQSKLTEKIRKNQNVPKTKEKLELKIFLKVQNQTQQNPGRFTTKGISLLS